MSVRLRERTRSCMCKHVCMHPCTQTCTRKWWIQEAPELRHHGVWKCERTFSFHSPQRGSSFHVRRRRRRCTRARQSPRVGAVVTSRQMNAKLQRESARGWSQPRPVRDHGTREVRLVVVSGTTTCQGNAALKKCVFFWPASVHWETYSVPPSASS